VAPHKAPIAEQLQPDLLGGLMLYDGSGRSWSLEEVAAPLPPERDARRWFLVAPGSRGGCRIGCRGNDT
jgi:hypothetical protein